MLLHKLDCLLYITRAGFNFFSKDFQDGLVLTIPNNVIKDLEIISKDKLKEQIELFLTEHKLQSTKTIMVLSDDVLFIKTVSLDLLQQEKEIREFLDKVPFDHEELVYELKSELKSMSVVATNSDLYLTIKNIFESKGWSIEMIVPDVGEVPNATNWQNVLVKALELKQYNFLINKRNVGDFLNSSPTDSRHNRTLPIIIVVFLLIAIILILAVYFKLK